MSWPLLRPLPRWHTSILDRHRHLYGIFRNTFAAALPKEVQHERENEQRDRNNEQVVGQFDRVGHRRLSMCVVTSNPRSRIERSAEVRRSQVDAFAKSMRRLISAKRASCSRSHSTVACCSTRAV